MDNRLSVLASLLLWIASPSSSAEGSAEAGEAKSATCAACHGEKGNSVNPDWPSLAGQHATYLVKQLKAFKTGERKNVLMSSQAMVLSEQDMEDLAAYYALQTAVGREADPALASLGKRLYQGGSEENRVSACIACHGPAGQGVLPSAYPAVAGQHATYLAQQLRAYASGERGTDPSQMMRNIARRMTEEQITAVSSYMQGLRARKDMSFLVD